MFVSVKPTPNFSLFRWSFIAVLGLILTACTATQADVAISAEQIHAEPDPITEDAPLLDNTKPEDDDAQVETKEKTQEADLKVVGLDISQIPIRLISGQKSQKLNARIQMSDGSLSMGVIYSLANNGEVIRKEGDYLFALKPGTAILTVRSLRDPSIQEEISIEVEPGSDSPLMPDSGGSSDGIPENIAKPVSGLKDTLVLNDYYLNDYRVGMHWEYQVQLGAIAAASGTGAYPETVTMGWGIEMTHFELEGEAASNYIIGILKAHREMAFWTLDVVEVGENTVTIRSEFRSNHPFIASQPAVTRTYTPETIGELYAGLVQTSNPNARTLTLQDQGVVKTSFYQSPPVDFVTDLWEGQTLVKDGLHQTEDVSLWFNKEVGLVFKEIHLRGNRSASLSVDTGLIFKLIAFEG